MPQSAGLFADRRTTWRSFEGQDGAYLLSAPLNVAQVSNLLYRRFPIGKASAVPRLWRRRSVCGLRVGDLRYNRFGNLIWLVRRRRGRDLMDITDPDRQFFVHLRYHRVHRNEHYHRPEV
ncbi:MAG: hypothetical protein DME18_12840 [Verrucomicrobia bacterium]|nr:MAG: hypothetical protein DME18_12840 [Verrucomicrobiota bacterium]